MQQFVHPADRERVRQQFAEWRRSRLTDKELNLRIVRRDGTQRDIFSHTRSDGPAGRPSLFGLVIDVTERRAAERALQQANERAALAARGAGVGTWETSLRGGQDRWDEQMWRLRGLDPKPDAPSEAERLDLVHPDDHARFGAALERAARHGDAMVETEFRVRLPDGRWRWLASRSVAVPDAQGEPDRRIGVNWDITDKHLAEAARQAQAQTLGEVRAKAQLLARMSHELRTPLNAVIGFAQLLLAEDRDDSEAAVLRRQRLEHIRSAGRHLLTLINDVLDLASLEGGEIRVTMTPVPLAALVAETLPLAEPQARAQGVRLQLDAVEGVALADPTRLRQVLINLLSNAVKYNRDGGEVTVAAQRRDGRVVLSVRDNGRGMSAQQIQRLFEPFNRLGAEQEAIEGSGIGLAIVKALVERMGGAVQVTSIPGRGSRFEVILADAEQPAGPLSAAAGTGVRGTLLYIEDNAVNALIVEELVAQRSDLRLLGAVDGGQGLALARSAQPDLILLDMQLPDMDGFELLRRLREEPLTAAIPCIALSANAMPADIHRALAAGLLDYWTKPLDFDAFMASLERLFG
jgi:signal transduction histidine kinase/CheY-like chemotaxis protein